MKNSEYFEAVFERLQSDMKKNNDKVISDYLALIDYLCNDEWANDKNGLYTERISDLVDRLRKSAMVSAELGELLALTEKRAHDAKKEEAEA